MKAEQTHQEVSYSFSVEMTRTELDEFIAGAGQMCSKLREEVRRARAEYGRKEAGISAGKPINPPRLEA